MDKYLWCFFLEIWKEQNSFISRVHAFGWSFHDIPSEFQAADQHFSLASNNKVYQEPNTSNGCLLKTVR